MGSQVISVGKWGRQSGGPQNEWSFELEKDLKLVKITIYSLMFTSNAEGVLHTLNKVGGWNGGETVSEVNLEGDEEITGINGSTGSRSGFSVITSLSFKTKKRTRGPFGTATESVFSIPGDKGSLVGFYGLAGYYIDAISVYLKAFEGILRVGTWGTTEPEGPQNSWSFQLEKDHHLNNGDLIYSLMFTTQYEDLTHTTKQFGGWNGGENVSQVIFEPGEQITAVNGTVVLSRGNAAAGLTIISSLSFITNKKSHGPFGNVRGTPFTVTWDAGSFIGFYGLAGYYIDSIGVYLKAVL